MCCRREHNSLEEDDIGQTLLRFHLDRLLPGLLPPLPQEGRAFRVHVSRTWRRKRSVARKERRKPTLKVAELFHFPNSLTVTWHLTSPDHGSPFPLLVMQEVSLRGSQDPTLLAFSGPNATYNSLFYCISNMSVSLRFFSIRI